MTIHHVDITTMQLYQERTSCASYRGHHVMGIGMDIKRCKDSIKTTMSVSVGNTYVVTIII